MPATPLTCSDAFQQDPKHASPAMNIPLVDLKVQYQALKTEIDAAIASVISETAFIGNMSNKYVKKFEAEFSKYTGAKHTIACANGTDSLEILLKAAGIGAGDEVLVPAVSCALAQLWLSACSYL